MGNTLKACIVLVIGPLFWASCSSSDTAPGPTQPSGARMTLTVGPAAEFRTIQSAVDAASAGATITVLPGTYGEHVVITRSLKIDGRQAVLDGVAGGLNGRFLGFEVRADDVEISGMVVQNFERGIVVDHALRFRLRSGEIRNNTSKDPPPISAGVTKSDGVVLIQCQDSEIAGNFIHDNGSIGLLMSTGSSGNTVRSNRFVNNGTQQGLQGSGFGGAGIFTIILNNNRNTVVDNDVSGSYWGIQIGSSSDSANIIQNNRVHGNHRAGIAVFGQHNRIEGNDVTGNGLMNMLPSCALDLMDWNGSENDWIGNTGSFGVASNQTPRSCS